MPELHDWYDRTTVASRITQPPFGDLVRRARHRVRRQRMVGAAVMVALVAVPLLGLPGSGDRPDPPVQTPTTSPPTSPELPGRLQDQEDRSINVWFFDTRHGYAFYQAAPWHECATWLSYTADGGRTWSELRELPGSYHDPSDDDYGGCTGPQKNLLAAESLMVRSVDPGTSDLAVSHLSHDAGRTWREYQPQVRTAESVPPGVIPTVKCDNDDCDQAWVSWYDPTTGDQRVLSSTPAGLSHSDAVTVAADGSLWVDGRIDNGYRLFVSRDRGRTWHERTPEQLAGWPPPLPDGDVPFEVPEQGASFTTHDGVTGYISRFVDGEPPGLLYRTTDGGESWQRLPDPPFSLLGTEFFVAPDGTLWATEYEQGYLSYDQGETFQPADWHVWGIRQVPGGYVGAPVDWSIEYGGETLLSEDGLTWRAVVPPR